MSTRQLITNRHTFSGSGSLQQRVPLLNDPVLPTLLFCGRSFLNGRAWQQLQPQRCGVEIVSHENEIDAWVTRWRGALGLLRHQCIYAPV